MKISKKKYNTPWHFSSKDIGYIQLKKSGNLNPVNITEPEMINNIIKNLENKNYKFKNFNIGNGWTYRILIYSTEGRLKDEFKINHNNSLRYGFGVYSYSKMDISFISDYFE